MTVSVCPQCASAKVASYDLSEDPGRHDPRGIVCLSCGWLGLPEKLLVAEESGEVIGSVQQALDIAAEVASEYMKCLAKYAARPIGSAMVEAGMVGNRDTKSLTRLIKAACQGAHRATLNEVEQIQKEYQDARRNAVELGEAGRVPGDR